MLGCCMAQRAVQWSLLTKESMTPIREWCQSGAIRWWCVFWVVGDAAVLVVVLPPHFQNKAIKRAGGGLVWLCRPCLGKTMRAEVRK